VQDNLVITTVCPCWSSPGHARPQGEDSNKHYKKS
jgi:hypothetical protein